MNQSNLPAIHGQQQAAVAAVVVGALAALLWVFLRHRS